VNPTQSQIRELAWGTILSRVVSVCYCGSGRDILWRFEEYCRSREDIGSHADEGGSAAVVSGEGWVVSKESCFFERYRVCITASLCTVRRASLYGPVVF
jgi:hypothetical protein